MSTQPSTCPSIHSNFASEANFDILNKRTHSTQLCWYIHSFRCQAYQWRNKNQTNNMTIARSIVTKKKKKQLSASLALLEYIARTKNYSQNKLSNFAWMFTIIPREIFKNRIVVVFAVLENISKINMNWKSWFRSKYLPNSLKLNLCDKKRRIRLPHPLKYWLLEN